MSPRLPEQVLNEQEARVVHLRDEQKWRLQQIADELGVSKERVRQCYSRARAKLADVEQHGEEALSLLPSRAARIVQDYELSTRAEVRMAILTGLIYWSYWGGESLCTDGWRTRNAGWQCWEHLNAWARLPPPVHDRSQASPDALKRPWREQQMSDNVKTYLDKSLDFVRRSRKAKSSVKS